MSYLIQRGKIRSQMINVPEGLPELLSDITREVLRCQPTTDCLCEFIIDYLHAIVMTREKALMAKMIIDRALSVVDEIIADMCVCNIPKIKADQMSEAMEECFRRFLAQRRCERNKTNELIKFNEIDILDELIQKCKFTEDELKISRPVIEMAYQKFVDAYMTAQENTEGTEALYQYFRERERKREEDHKRQEAAIKIQTNVRGFLARRSMSKKVIEKPLENISGTDEDLLKKDVAARKIQRYYRLHKHKEKTFESRDLVTIEFEKDDENQAKTPTVEQNEDKQRSENLDEHETVVVEEHYEYEAMIPTTEMDGMEMPGIQDNSADNVMLEESEEYLSEEEIVP